MRIRFREAAVAARSRKGCLLVVADGLGDERAEGFEIRDLGLAKGGRLSRFFLGSLRAWRYLRRLKPDLVHFHDPELIPVALFLMLTGCRTVYDVHEDVPRQILHKYWLPSPVRRPVAWMMAFLEWLGAGLFTAIVTATPKIAERFPAKKTAVVQNFPILSELLVPHSAPYAQRPPYFAYLGTITRIRGVEEMIEALALLPPERGARLRLAGDFSPVSLSRDVSAMPGWNGVDYLDWVNRKQAAELLAGVRAGLVLFHPLPNHIDAQPNKLFEYMAASLPVIASDFPLWRRIVGDNGCGLLVDPLNAKAIAEAMKWMLEHPREAEAMGRRGREAVKTRYNWDNEREILLGLYSKLLQ